MKKQLLLLVVILLPMVVRGYDFQNDGIYYNIMDNENHTLYVTYAYPNEKNSDSYTGDIVVPEEVIHNGIKYTVFGIGTQAFKFCNKVTSVVLPQSIVNLSNNAFENCSSLNSINIPESVPYIGSYSFSGCKNLTSINGGSGVIGIQDYAFQNCSALTTINMFTNLASIEGGAFKGCTGLTSVIIPKSVKSIRNNPFPDCPNITSIEVEDANEYYDSRNDCNAIVDTKNNTLLSGCMNTSIPEDAVKIGDDAFSGCVGLTSITIPESVSSIGSCAFLNCSGLTSITIPNRVTYIGGAVFSGCSGLSSIIVEKDNTRYDSRNDCNAIIDKKNNTLLSGCMNTVIPEDVVKIGNTAFSGCCGLTSLDIPNSITSIESYAFSGCTGLPSLYISMNVSYIAETAFEGCTGISSIIVDPNNSIYDSRDNCNAIVKGNMLILACDNTVLPLNVTSFSWYAFCNCSTVEIPDGVESMPYNLFYNCPHLKLIKIPKSVKSIEPSSINECNNLKTIIFEDGEDELKFTNTYISEPEWIIGCSLDSLYIGRNINYKFTKSNQTYDYYSPFRNNETLRVVKFNSNIIDLQNNYFSGCTNLTSVYLPDNLKSIGSGAFSRCSSLQSIEFNSNLDSISYSAFYGCSSLKKIVIPSNVRTIGSNAFANTNLSELIIEEDDKDIDMIEAGSEKYICSGASIDYVYWGRNGAAINYKKIKHLVLGNINHFSKVGANIGPFSYYKGCDTINVLSIRSSSDTLHFVVDEKVNYSQWTYNYTLPFKDIHIDSVYCDRVIDVYDSYNTGRTFYPFEGVNSSFKLAIGNSITDISNNMFAGCKIPSVLIPKNINRIGLTAFYGCSTLSKLIIEDSMEPINIEDGNTFYACPLKNMYIGRNINYPSNNSPFKSHKEGVESLIIGENVTEIGIEEFYGLKNLTSIALPNSLKKIGSMAFYGCDGLTELAIPSSVNEIGQQAFDLCRGLKTLTFEDGEEELAFTAEPNFINNSFCNSPLEKIYLGRNIIYTNVSPFSVMESIKELTLGSKVTRLSKGAFGGCPNLKEVYSNAETIPTTEENVFTESYLANATLHVPYSLYDEYRVTYPWSKFGNMFNYEGKYNLFYVVDEVEYKKYVVNEGDAITPETEPTKEGYTFSGWSEIPATMPAHDVTVTGTFTQETGINQIMVNQNGKAMIFTIDGKRVDNLKKGLNVIRMKDGTMRKVVVK